MENSENSEQSLTFDKRSERLRGEEYDQVSSRTFNLVMVLTILYGLVLNVALVHYAAAPLIQWIAGCANPKGVITLFFVGYFVVSLAGIILSGWSTNPVVSFIGFSLVAFAFGVLLCFFVPHFQEVIVFRAIGITACVTLVIAVMAVANPNIFLSMGKALFITLLVGLIAEIVVTFIFKYTGTVFDWIFVIVFSGYIGYDVARSQQYSKTLDNAVDCAVDLYMDIINLFVRLLSILGKKK